VVDHCVFAGGRRLSTPAVDDIASPAAKIAGPASSPARAGAALHNTTMAVQMNVAVDAEGSADPGKEKLSDNGITSADSGSGPLRQQNRALA